MVHDHDPPRVLERLDDSHPNHGNEERRMKAEDEPVPGKAKRGRPRVYTQDIADRVLERLANGESLSAICRDDGMAPRSTVIQWALDDVEGFAARYARAREIGAYSWADDMLEIADDTSNDTQEGRGGPQANNEWISRSKVRLDARKWLASKILPHVFGDRIATQTLGKDGQPVDPGGMVMMIDMGNGPQTAAQIAAERDGKK